MNHSPTAAVHSLVVSGLDRETVKALEAQARFHAIGRHEPSANALVRAFAVELAKVEPARVWQALATLKAYQPDAPHS